MFRKLKKIFLLEVQPNILSRHLQSWVSRVTAKEQFFKSSFTRNLYTLMCLLGLSESTLTNLKKTNVWKRIKFNLRRDYLKKVLQEIADKILKISWVGHVKISFILPSDLKGSYCRIHWKIRIDSKIGKERRLVKYRVINLCYSNTLPCCKFQEDEFWWIWKAVKTTQGKVKWL